jgi:hypothetical protein
VPGAATRLRPGTVSQLTAASIGQLAARPAQVADRRAASVPIQRRTTLTHLAILAAVAAALRVRPMVASAFVGARHTVALSIPVAMLLILAMGALTVSLTRLLRAIFLAVSS